MYGLLKMTRLIVRVLTLCKQTIFCFTISMVMFSKIILKSLFRKHKIETESKLTAVQFRSAKATRV